MTNSLTLIIFEQSLFQLMFKAAWFIVKWFSPCEEGSFNLETHMLSKRVSQKLITIQIMKMMMMMRLQKVSSLCNLRGHSKSLATSKRLSCQQLPGSFLNLMCESRVIHSSVIFSLWGGVLYLETHLPCAQFTVLWIYRTWLSYKEWSDDDDVDSETRKFRPCVISKDMPSHLQHPRDWVDDRF